MKKLALAAALTAVASTAVAGGLEAPVMEPEVVVEESSSSSGGNLVLPLLLLVAVAAIASN